MNETRSMEREVIDKAVSRKLRVNNP